MDMQIKAFVVAECLCDIVFSLFFIGSFSKETWEKGLCDLGLHS